MVDLLNLTLNRKKINAQTEEFCSSAEICTAQSNYSCSHKVDLSVELVL